MTVCGTHGCVMTSPDQKVNAGTDVHLSCNFSQCPGPLDVMSLSVEWEFKVGLFFIFFRNTDTHTYFTLFIQACIIIIIIIIIIKLLLLFVFF